MAPFGGSERRLGTNPFAWAAPRRPEPPLVMDWSTATMAEGKLAVARARGETVPDGVLVDADGEPSTDPPTSTTAARCCRSAPTRAPG